ncbi:hypothetical protein [Phascolarctobacterium sp.]|uniref:hypothetical protein n=1 Tax=Phascolarctobacterium sp. TaxID=2049039 RepID=UPI00386DBACA
MSTFSVTLNYNCNYGYVEYNEESKTAIVTLAVAEAKAAVEKFLATPLTLDIPQGATIRDFGTATLEPLSSLANFKTCLTRLWGKTGVRVEWSMPPGMAEKL